MIEKKLWSRAIACLCAASSCLAIHAEGRVMNLEECIAYAKEHSITLQQANIEVDRRIVDESSAKSAFLPSVSGSVSQGLSSTPLASGSGDKSRYNGSYGVDLAMTLYKGGENTTLLKKSKVSSEIARLGLSEKEDILEVAITQVYVEILYATEQINVAKSSVALSEKNVERGRLQLEIGKINEADLAQLETAVATEQYNLVVAQNKLSSKYLTLRQLLEITDATPIEVDTTILEESVPAGAISSIGETYASALESRPEIAASSLSVESAKMDERIAKSGYLPKLSLTAGVGVNHNSTSDYTFSQQLRNNYNNSVGLNLSIPIFNKFATRNAVTKSKYATRYATLTHNNEMKQLYQTIETLHTNALNAQSMYLVSQSRLTALEKSLALVTKQYEVGMKNIIELLTEQDDFRVASQQYLESKYTYILNNALLEFYKTGIIKL